MINDPKPIRLPVEDLKDFRISFDIMVRHDIGSLPNWREHPAVLAMVAMLEKKDIVQLFAEVIENEPYVDAEMVGFKKQFAVATDPSTDRDTREKVRKEIKDFLEEGMFYDGGNVPYQLYYIYSYRQFGVNLNQPINVSRNHPSYPLFFTFRLSRTHYPGEFLQHHLLNTFQNDVGEYKLFLSLLDKPMLGLRNDFLNEWVLQKLSKKDNKSKTKKKRRPPAELTFKVFFNNDDKIRIALSDFLFNAAGGVQGKKDTRLRELGWALFKKIETQDGGKYNGSHIADILEAEFGGKLGIKNERIRELVTIVKHLQNASAEALFSRIKDIY